MRRILFAVPMVMLAASAAAGGMTVINHSGLPIDELFASPAGKGTFGANLMEGMKEGALEDGMTAAVGALADGTYDLKISAPDEGVLCTIKGVEVKGGKVELTAKEGKACK